MVSLLCPVRGCRSPLVRSERAFGCARGHGFDLARSGYVNLLQPQDRRSATPGDRPEAVAARRRFLARGHAAPLIAALSELCPASGAAVLDVGCGEGTFLRALGAGRNLELHGLDLSVAALVAAARAQPEACFVAANADRFLPYADASFDLVLSITARLHPAEMARVMKPAGRLVIVVPGPDDLVELRQAVLGRGLERERWPRIAAELAGRFSAGERRRVCHRGQFTSEDIALALAATYRAARPAERERALALAALAVTMSWDVGVFSLSPPA